MLGFNISTLLCVLKCALYKMDPVPLGHGFTKALITVTIPLLPLSKVCTPFKLFTSSTIVPFLHYCSVLLCTGRGTDFGPHQARIVSLACIDGHFKSVSRRMQSLLYHSIKGAIPRMSDRINSLV